MDGQTMAIFTSYTAKTSFATHTPPDARTDMLSSHTIKFLLCLVSAVISADNEEAFPNGTEPRTWKYVGYFVSKITAAAAKTVSIPVVIIPNTIISPPSGTTNPPGATPAPSQPIPNFTISPDTAVFPTFTSLPSQTAPELFPGPVNPSPDSLPTMFVTPGEGESFPLLGFPPSNFPGPISPADPSPPSVIFQTLPNSPLPFPTVPPLEVNTISSLPEAVFASNVSPTTAPALHLPTGLTGGIILSHIGIPVAQVPSPNLPTPTGAVQCGCVAAGTCVTTGTGTETGGFITTRIVTQNTGATCPAGQQYCCVQTSAPQTTSCGVRNVIPGVFPGPSQANLGEYPWSGIILTAQNQYIGGAALIDNTHLLTVAHVVANHGNGANLKIRLGEWDIAGSYEPVQYLDYAILNIVQHPNFVPSTLQHDIAIISLQRPVTLLTNPTPQVNTVCLPSPSDDFTGETCFVAGWGKDSFTGSYQNIIKEVDVPVLGNAECQARLRTTRLGPQWNLDTTSFLCAGGVASKDSCQGDGGNALVCQRGGRFFVAGITAGGVECGLNNIPGLYTRVTSYLPWIASQIAGSTQAPPVGIDPRRQG